MQAVRRSLKPGIPLPLLRVHQSGRELDCREGYKGAAGAMAHVDNVGELLQKFMQICELTKLEVHGLPDELDQLRPTLKALPVVFFELQMGFRR